MKSFDKEIKQFLIDGAFNNNLDDAANINLSIDPIDVNQRYIEFGLKNYLYNNDQIKMLYDVEIKEFSIPVTIAPVNNTDNNTSQLIQENEILKNQLNAVIAADNQNSASAIVDASKDLIIKLRIKLNEGKSTDDFSDAFPYLKK
jgi:hypothetical protein